MCIGERQISRNVIYRGRILDLRVDNVRLPNGRKTLREVVDHSDAVAIVAIEGDSLYLVQQFRYAVGEEILELPAGLVEKGEEPSEAALRELQEEIGFKASSLEEVGFFYSSPGFSNEKIIVFLASGLSPSKLEADDDEFIKVHKVSLVELKKMIRDGKIVDSKTIASISWLALEGKI